MLLTNFSILNGGISSPWIFIFIIIFGPLTLRDAINKKYNSKYPAANAVAFLIYKNKEQSFSSTNASFMQKK